MGFAFGKALMVFFPHHPICGGRCDAELTQEILRLPALEEQVEGILGLLQELREELVVAPNSDEGRPQIKEQLVKLDLMLHHLVAMLERIVEWAGAASTPLPERERAQEMLGELRQWVDGYIAGATKRMGRIEALLARLDRFVIRSFGRPPID